MLVSNTLMFSSNLDSRGSSDLFSSRSSVFRNPGLFSLSGSGLSVSGGQDNFDRRNISDVWFRFGLAPLNF